MKPRVVSTYKILAVAITAGVGCTNPEPRREQADPTSPPAPSAAAPSAVAIAAPSSPLAPSAEGVTTHAPPPPDDKVDPKLLALRLRLADAGREKALSDEKTFRPLCDAEGYPLVGNLARKSPDGPFSPSALCAELRAKKRS